MPVITGGGREPLTGIWRQLRCRQEKRPAGFWESLLTFAYSILLHWCKQLEQWLPYIFVIALECCSFKLPLPQWHCLLWLFTVDQDWCSFSCSVSSTFLRLCAKPRKYIPARSLQSPHCFLITFKMLLHLLRWNTHKTQLTILKCIFQWYLVYSQVVKHVALSSFKTMSSPKNSQDLALSSFKTMSSPKNSQDS